MTNRVFKRLWQYKLGRSLLMVLYFLISVGRSILHIPQALMNKARISRMVVNMVWAKYQKHKELPKTRLEKDSTVVFVNFKDKDK